MPVHDILDWMQLLAFVGTGLYVVTSARNSLASFREAITELQDTVKAVQKKQDDMNEKVIRLEVSKEEAEKLRGLGGPPRLPVTS